MKKYISLLLIFCFLAPYVITASAEETSKVGGATPMLSFSGTTAYCKLTITAATRQIECTLTLSEGGVDIASWSGSGISYVAISESITVQHGHTYTLSGTATVNGSPITITPITKTCP